MSSGEDIISNDTLKVHFSTIITEFSKQYDNVYDGSSKKAHLDCVDPSDRTIDGAKKKWCAILLLDAILYSRLIPRYHKSHSSRTRRAFNQHVSLYDSIRSSLPSMEGAISRIIVSFDNAQDWYTSDKLLSHIINDPPTKSKKKYIKLADYLCNYKNNLEKLSNKPLYEIISDLIVEEAIELYSKQSTTAIVPLFAPVKKSNNNFDELDKNIYDILTHDETDKWSDDTHNNNASDKIINHFEYEVDTSRTQEIEISPLLLSSSFNNDDIDEIKNGEQLVTPAGNFKKLDSLTLLKHVITNSNDINVCIMANVFENENMMQSLKRQDSMMSNVSNVLDLDLPLGGMKRDCSNISTFSHLFEFDDKVGRLRRYGSNSSTASSSKRILSNNTRNKIKRI